MSQLSEEQQKIGKQLLGDKWDNLTYWQQMCEIAALQQNTTDKEQCGFLSLSKQLLGFDLF